MHAIPVDFLSPQNKKRNNMQLTTTDITMQILTKERNKMTAWLPEGDWTIILRY